MSLVKAVVADKLVKEMAQLLRSAPFSDDQQRELYDAIAARVSNKTCRVCKKIRPKFEMEYSTPDGDLRNVGWRCKETCV